MTNIDLYLTKSLICGLCSVLAASSPSGLDQAESAAAEETVGFVAHSPSRGQAQSGTAQGSLLGIGNVSSFIVTRRISLQILAFKRPNFSFLSLNWLFKVYVCYI